VVLGETGSKVMKPLTGLKILQSGFTLIEALIAFLVLTVGLLGASIFHSSLLRETSDTRARLGANFIAEAEIENVRNAVALLAETDDVALAISNAIPSVAVVSGNESYDVTLKAPPVAVSGARTLHEYTLVISWPGGESVQESIEITSYIGWSNQSTSEESGVDLSGAAAGYEGNIPVPTGTLTALDRQVISAASLAEGSVVKQTNDYKVYSLPSSVADNDLIVGIEIGGDFVQLAKLNAEQNELFSITGRILNDTAYPVQDKFGCTYSGATTTSANAVCDSAFPDEDVIDIAATGGAGCIIYSYTNENVDGAGGANDLEAKIGDFICIAGTGWNGQIAPRILDVENPGATDTQASLDGLVCSPELRGYKYVILEPEDPDIFATAVSNATTSVQRRALLDATSVAGQSGLIRFYQDNDPNKTDEGVYWGSYFWHNPDYIVEPSASNFSYYVYDELTEQYSGDVAYQNYFLFSPPSGNPKKTCANYGIGRYETLVAGSGGYDAVVSSGIPGWNYTPSLSDFDLASFNEVQLSVEAGDDQDKGVLILGYTLAKFSIKGTLYIDSGSTLAASDFEMGGNPEPVVSIECDISDVVDDASVTGFDGYSYSCGIPTSWAGSIYAHPKTYTTDVDSCVIDKNEDGTATPDRPPALLAVKSDGGVEFPTYYKYWTDVLDLSGVDEDFQDFSELSITRYAPTSETKEGGDFYFAAGEACP